MSDRTGTARRLRPPLLGLTLAGLLALTACSSGASAPGTRQSGPAAATVGISTSPKTPTTRTSTAAAARPTRSTTPPPTRAELRGEATTKIDKLSTGRPVVSVAALNTVTGASYSSGAKAGIWTASVYKLLVLETLVLQHQRAGTTLSGSEATAATTMIENSDDPAGYELFLDLGGTPGLTTGIRRLGLTHTVPGRSDPTFTTTGAADCITLLTDLVRKNSPLDARSRDYIVDLMHAVESDQRWGVGVVADRGTTFANKNGWLSVDDTNGPGEVDDGLWITNSVGIVTVHGQQVLMAVLTEHNPDFASGVNLVQKLARVTVTTVSTPS